jgi:catechol 2,3-dioxygenase-like lactoylglutathione lyase family enzyme
MLRMAYRELAPPRALAGVVRCLWLRETAEEEDVLVTPDGCVDVVVRDGHAFVAGPDTAPVWSHVPAGSLTVGVRLRPGAAAAALGVPADALRDQRVALEDLWGLAGRRLGARVDSDPARLLAAPADPLGRDPDLRVVGAVRLPARTPSLPIPAVADAVGARPGGGRRGLRRPGAHDPRAARDRRRDSRAAARSAADPRRDVRILQDGGWRRLYAVGMKILFVASFSPIVADPAAAKALYANALGISFEGVAGDYMYTEKLGGVKHFGVWPLVEAAEACFGTKEWPAKHRVPQASVEFEVEDVAAAAAELVAAGHTLIHPARTEPWGQSIARVLSADGLIVGVCWTPSMH